MSGSQSFYVVRLSYATNMLSTKETLTSFGQPPSQHERCSKNEFLLFGTNTDPSTCFRVRRVYCVFDVYSSGL